MKTKGLKVIPINPNTDKTQGGDVCYPNLKSVPSKIESAVILTAAKHTDSIVKEAVEYGIKNLWIQQKSDTKTAIELAEKNNINVIHHQCIMMFSEPVTGFHKFHKSIKKLFGALPR
jgi:predicted CoA-binding protein